MSKNLVTLPLKLRKESRETVLTQKPHIKVSKTFLQGGYFVIRKGNIKFYLLFISILFMTLEDQISMCLGWQKTAQLNQQQAQGAKSTWSLRANRYSGPSYCFCFFQSWARNYTAVTIQYPQKNFTPGEQKNGLQESS